jgi:uncharacterized protein YdbL (DUF1318 family)
VPEEKIAVLAGQIEDVVLNMTPDDLATYEINQEADEGVDELEIMQMMAAADEIREKIPALAELNINNEIVLTAIRGRVLRRPAVKEFEQNGCVGENRRGFLQYLGSKWCRGDRYVRNRASFIILNENRDRRVIYEQLIEANNLGGSAMMQIREIFAREIYKRAWAGTPLQMPNGTWERR